MYLFNKLLYSKSLHYLWLKHFCCKMVIYVMYCCIPIQLFFCHANSLSCDKGWGRYFTTGNLMLSRSRFLQGAAFSYIRELSKCTDAFILAEKQNTELCTSWPGIWRKICDSSSFVFFVSLFLFSFDSSFYLGRIFGRRRLRSSEPIQWTCF